LIKINLNKSNNKITELRDGDQAHAPEGISYPILTLTGIVKYYSGCWTFCTKTIL